MEPRFASDFEPGADTAAVGFHTGDPEPLLDRTEDFLLQTLVRLDEAEAKAVNLEHALDHARDIGAAMGVLMSLRRVTKEDAFQMLRRASMRRNIKLHTLAQEVVETGSLDG